MDGEGALEVVSEMLAVLIEKTKLEGKEGGAFCIVDQATRECVVRPTLIGKTPDEKKDKYLELCLEKAMRLCEMHETKEHWLSWESRDPDNGKWGGAIHDGQYAWSFSGLPEESDEALMLMSAHMSGRIMNGAPEGYAETSDNKIILDGGYLFWKPRE